MKRFPLAKVILLTGVLVWWALPAQLRSVLPERWVVVARQDDDIAALARATVEMEARLAGLSADAPERDALERRLQTLNRALDRASGAALEKDLPGDRSGVARLRHYDELDLERLTAEHVPADAARRLIAEAVGDDGPAAAPRGIGSETRGDEGATAGGPTSGPSEGRGADDGGAEDRGGARGPGPDDVAGGIRGPGAGENGPGREETSNRGPGSVERGELDEPAAAAGDAADEVEGVVEETPEDPGADVNEAVDETKDDADDLAGEAAREAEEIREDAEDAAREAVDDVRDDADDLLDDPLSGGAIEDRSGPQTEPDEEEQLEEREREQDEDRGGPGGPLIPGPGELPL